MAAQSEVRLNKTEEISTDLGYCNALEAVWDVDNDG